LHICIYFLAVYINRTFISIPIIRMFITNAYIMIDLRKEMETYLRVTRLMSDDRQLFVYIYTYIYIRIEKK